MIWLYVMQTADTWEADAEAVRRHYTVTHMADAVLKAYQDAQRQSSVENLPHAGR